MAHTPVKVTTHDGKVGVIKADVVLIATGASPRVLPGAEPDGERILNWRQLYDLDELPEHLVIVGSGVTGAEFCNAYTELGVKVTVVASRDQILPHEDSDAAAVLEEALAERGVTLVKNARAESVTRDGDGVLVTMTDGRTVEGSHALMTVGSVPNTGGLGLEKRRHRTGAGQLPDRRPGVADLGVGHLRGGRLHRADAAGLGRGHAGPHRDVPRAGRGASARSGCAPSSAAVFTRPEIAAVGVPQTKIDDGTVPARTMMLPLNTNARAKMSLLRRRLREDLLPPGHRRGDRRRGGGADRLGADPADRAGGAERPNGDDLAQTLSVYPSLSGSIIEAARRLMAHDDLD